MSNDHALSRDVFLLSSSSSVTHEKRKSIYSLIAGVLFCVTLGGVTHAQEGTGGIETYIGTTISHGVSLRMEEQNQELIDFNPNGDDGNLNYDKGLISNTTKMTTDFEFRGENGGVFSRVSAFIDHFQNSQDLERTQLTNDAKELVGTDLRVLDLYAYRDFTVGGMLGDVRLGQQVINWGESTFIQNGINIVNPVDVSRLRTPGSELREALVPVPMIAGSIAPTDELSLEAFIQLQWKKTEIDPVGSYFSTNDYIGVGGTRAEIDLRDIGVRLPPNDLDDWLYVGRVPDIEPEDSGQYGLALRYFAEEFNNTEFGVFFTNYHSRRPVATARGGSGRALQHGVQGAQAVTTAGVNAVTAVGINAAQYLGQAIAGGQRPDLAVAGYVNSEPAFAYYSPEQKNQLIRQILETTAAHGLPNALPIVLESQAPQILANAVLTKGPTLNEAIFGYVNSEPAFANYSAYEKQQLIGQLIGVSASAGLTNAPAPIQFQGMSQVLPQVLEGYALQITLDRFGKDAYYRVEYPEDISMFGISFNTLLEKSGWALQGEFSIQNDYPLQRDDASIFAEGLEPIFGALDPTVGCPALIDPAQIKACIAGLATSLGAGLPVQGYVRRNVTQAQLTATKVFGPILGAESGLFLIEVARTNIHDMPDTSVFPLEGFGGNYATDSAWGYRVVTKLDFPGAIGGVNLSPYLQYKSDVKGTTPPPISNFIEGTRAYTIGVAANYLHRWGSNLGYTIYDGAGFRNGLIDRDYLSFSVNYSF